MISKTLQQEFRQVCQETLGFVSAYGFSEARLSEEPSVCSTTVRFYGKALTIECIWDSRDEVLEVKIARLRDGRPPTEFAVDSSGRRVRDEVISFLMRHGVRGFGFRRQSQRSDVSARWRTELEDYARLLQQHGEAVLREDPAVLD